MPRLVKIAKPFRSTWMGRSGCLYVHHFDGRKDGKRVTFMKWNDTVQVDIEVIQGDGRTSKFKRLFKDSMHSGVIDRNLVAQELADKHWGV